MSFKIETAEIAQYRVAEIFGPTIQGEGPYVGEPCYFIRLGGCDYRCSWCDSMHAVEPAEVAKLPIMTPEQIILRLDELKNVNWKTPFSGPALVVVSGGNPLIWKNPALMYALRDAGYLIQIETQGSVWKSWAGMADCVVVSPKPPSSNMDVDLTKLKAFAAQANSYNNNIQWKFVVFDGEDLKFALNICTMFHLKHVYISIGTLATDDMNDIVDRWRSLIPVAMNTFKDSSTRIQIFPQLHVLLWSHAKGV